MRTFARQHGGAAMVACAHALPRTVIGNDYIAQTLDVSEQWILDRTGIEERRWLSGSESLIDLAVEAGARCLSNAGIEPCLVDQVIVATSSADRIVPPLATVVAHKLSAVNAATFDVVCGCVGFISALYSAAVSVESGRASAVLVIAAENLSPMIDLRDKGTAALFGDGAGAVLVISTPYPRVGAFVMGSDGAFSECAYIERSEAKIRMKGGETFKHAVRRMSEATAQACEVNGTSVSKIDHFIYHQANARIMTAVSEMVGIREGAAIDEISHVGNTSAASIPIALSIAVESGRIKGGDSILMCAFGSGWNYGATVCKWAEAPWRKWGKIKGAGNGQ